MKVSSRIKADKPVRGPDCGSTGPDESSALDALQALQQILIEKGKKTAAETEADDFL